MLKYDPEYQLQIQKHIESIWEGTDNIREILGTDHPLIEVMEAMDRLLMRLVEKDEEFTSCFDPDEESEIQKEILVICEEVHHASEWLSSLIDSLSLGLLLGEQ